MEDSSDNTNHFDMIDLDNNIEYKGQFGGDDNEDELQFYEHGAHFKYKALYNKLEQIVNAVHDNDLISCNSPCRNTSSHKQSKMNHKYVSNFMVVQSRNINNNNYHTNRQGNAVNGNGNNNQKCSEKNVMSAVNDKGMKGKSNHTFGTKTNNIGVGGGGVNNNNNNNHKKAPALSGNKNKNVVAKNTVKKTAKVDVKGNKNKVQSTTGNNNNVNSQSSSKPKNNNNIKSISNKKPISTISNNNQKVISATKHQTKLSSSYQNLCLNKIISPSKKPITQGIISNIKYKKVNTNPSLNKKQTSPPKNTTTTVTTNNNNNNNQSDIKKNNTNLKSRNGYNDILTQNTKNNKANNNNNNNNNVNVVQPTNNKKPKKDEDKQSLTYQQSNINTNTNNNDEQSKPAINGLITKNNNNTNTKTTTTNTNINKVSTHSKVRNEIIGIVIKQKPHSQDRPNNIFQSNVIKNVTNNITKKGTNTSNTRQNVSKPQSANIAYTIITSVKKGNSLTNRKASPPSAKQLNSYNRTTQRPQTHQPKPKPFLKKAVINNITTIHIPLSEGLSSSGSKNKKISSRNSRNTQVTKTAININTCINNNNNSNTRAVSNNVKHKLSIGKHGMKSIGKGSLNIKVKQIKAGSNSNSNKKGSSSLQGVSKTQENKNMKIINRGSVNVKDKQTHTHILITEHKVDMSEYNSCPIDIVKDKDELIL